MKDLISSMVDQTQQLNESLENTIQVVNETDSVWPDRSFWDRVARMAKTTVTGYRDKEPYSVEFAKPESPTSGYIVSAAPIPDDVNFFKFTWEDMDGEQYGSRLFRGSTPDKDFLLDSMREFIEGVAKVGKSSKGADAESALADLVRPLIVIKAENPAYSDRIAIKDSLTVTLKKTELKNTGIPAGSYDIDVDKDTTIRGFQVSGSFRAVVTVTDTLVKIEDFDTHYLDVD